MLESSGIGQMNEFIRAVFIGILGMHAFPFCEAKIMAGNTDLLIFQTDKMHFNPTQLVVVISIMLELIALEVAVKFVVDAQEQIKIEVCGDACRIVVGGIQRSLFFFAVNPDQQTPALTDQPVNSGQKVLNFQWIKIAKAGTRKKYHASALRYAESRRSATRRSRTVTTESRPNAVAARNKITAPSA